MSRGKLPCPPPVFWALSRIIHATTSFDAAVAVPGEIYSRVCHGERHTLGCGKHRAVFAIKFNGGHHYEPS